VPKTPVPRLGLIYVGEDWNDDAAAEHAVTGLRSPMQELFAESCGAGLRTLSNGRAVMDLEADPEISEDDAWLFLDFESERWLAERSDRGYWTAGYERYLALGLVRPAPRSSRKADEILRRSQWRQRADLHGQRDPAKLRDRLAVRFPQQGELFELDDPGREPHFKASVAP
jgi:hypothetical protein